MNESKQIYCAQIDQLWLRGFNKNDNKNRSGVSIFVEVNQLTMVWECQSAVILFA